MTDLLVTIHPRQNVLNGLGCALYSVDQMILSWRTSCISLIKLWQLRHVKSVTPLLFQFQALSQPHRPSRDASFVHSDSRTLLRTPYKVCGAPRHVIRSLPALSFFICLNSRLVITL